MKLETRALAVSFTLFAVVVPGLLRAQAPPDAALRVDTIFAPWSSPDSPGCAVAVEQHGLTVLSRAYGMADLEHDVPNTPETIFEGGSVSKQFTAAAVILLALDGKLSLDDDLRRYVPEVPDYGETITLRHLMNHTSGLRDWGSVASISGWGRQERTHTHAHVLDILSRQSALNFEPGHEYSYSNSGFNLLAVVVTRVSGIAFAEFSKQRIFEPLGMKDTQWRDDFTRIVKGRSSAYSVSDGEVGIMRPIEDVHGNGGILTTVADLLVWNRALTEGRLGGPDFRRMMHDKGRLNDGSEIFYASGLMVSNLGGVPSVTHTGSTSGYRAFLGRYPEQELSVAMLCNASNVRTGDTGERIARIYLGDAVHDPAEPTAVALPEEELERMAGLYRNERTALPMRLTVEDGTLTVDGRRALVAVGPNELQAGAGGNRYRFTKAAAGGRPSLLLIASDGSTETRFEPVAPFEPSASELSAFEGTYESYDAETTFVVSVVEGKLQLFRRPDTRVALVPEYQDAFDAPEIGFIRFVRDERGDVEALSLRLPRVYDMRFRRAGDETTE